MRPEEIDDDWLSRALQSALGVTAHVVGHDATSIGTGQVGENVRFRLRWDEAGDHLPDTIVGKFPSASEVSRAAAVARSTYVKEVGFYCDLQPEVGIRTPVVSTIEWDAATHDFVLLMEDITPARAGDQLAGCSVAEAELVIDQAVQLHAPTWGRLAELEAHDWLGGLPDDEQIAFRTRLFELLTPGFVDRFSSRLAADDLALAAPLGAAFPNWYEQVRAWVERLGAWCAVHGDFRLDNILFGEPPASPAVTVVDWQTVSIGTGPVDVAYFCGAGLLPEQRVQAEHDLVARYAGGLRAAGVDIPDEAVWEGYVLGSATGYYMAVLASQIVEQTERGDEMFAVMAERHADQMRTVGLLDRLGLS